MRAWPRHRYCLMGLAWPYGSDLCLDRQEFIYGTAWKCPDGVGVDSTDTEWSPSAMMAFFRYDFRPRGGGINVGAGGDEAPQPMVALEFALEKGRTRRAP